MAELGDFLSQEAKDVNVTIDMLDYAFVSECKDTKKLRAILDVLNSGKEGYYPDLIRHTEERLMTLLPEKEKQKLLRLKAKVNPIEIAEAERKLEEWERQIRDTDKTLKATSTGDATNSKTIFDTESATKTVSRSNLPPVRGSGSRVTVSPSDAKSTSTSSAADGQKHEEKSQRLSGYDFRAWEKFDVEAELQKIEEVESTERPRRDESQQKAAEKAREEKRAALHRREMEKILYEMDASSLNEVQRKARANREKQKGNEYFRVGDNQEAYNCYSRSIALDPTSAVVFGNRAITSIRLERFATAEDDCSRALELDSEYVKAWSRRGLAIFKQGRYAEAALDFMEALKREPKSTELPGLLQKATDKFREVEGKSFEEYLSNGGSKSGVGNGVGSQLKSASNAAATTRIAVAENTTSVPVSSVLDVSELFLPDLAAELVQAGDVVIESTAPNVTGERESLQSTGFTRIAITEDSDEDDEDQSEAENKTSGQSGFTRIAITEESDEEEEDDDDKQDSSEAVKEGVKNAADTAFTRIAISEEDDDDEGEKQDGPQNDNIPEADIWKDVHSPAAPQSKPKAETPSKSHSTGGESSPTPSVWRDVSSPEATAAPATSVSATNKEQANALKELGNKKYAEGQIEGAIAAYTESLQLDPSLVASLNNRAMAYIKIDRHKEALEDLNKVLNKEPSNTKALYRRGLCHNALGQPNQALADVDALLKIDPSNKQADALKLDARKKSLMDRAVANRKKGGQALFTALEDLDALLKLDPNDAAAKAERTQTAQLARKFQFSRAVPEKEKLKPMEPVSAPQGGSIGSGSGDMLMKESVTRKIARQPVDTDADVDRNLPPPPPTMTTVEATDRSPPAVHPRPPTATSASVSALSPKDSGATPSAAIEKKAERKAATTSTTSGTKRAPSVPTDPPKTLYELERIGRGLKDRPDLLAQYYSQFKKSTYKNVFKEAMSPELLSATLVCLRDSAEAPVAASVLEGLATTSSFHMIKILLDENDWRCVDAILHKLESATSEGNDKLGSTLSRLRTSFAH